MGDRSLGRCKALELLFKLWTKLGMLLAPHSGRKVRKSPRLESLKGWARKSRLEEGWFSPRLCLKDEQLQPPELVFVASRVFSQNVCRVFHARRN